MIIGHLIDGNGFFIGDVLEDNGITPDVTVICPNGFYKPKWNGNAWVEGLTQQEIDTIVNVPVEPSDQDKIDELQQTVADLIVILAEKGITP